MQPEFISVGSFNFDAKPTVMTFALKPKFAMRAILI